jgi:hypothetical protein
MLHSQSIVGLLRTDASPIRPQARTSPRSKCRGRALNVIRSTYEKRLPIEKKQARGKLALCPALGAANGPANFAHEPAMSKQQCARIMSASLERCLAAFALWPSAEPPVLTRRFSLNCRSRLTTQPPKCRSGFLNLFHFHRDSIFSRKLLDSQLQKYRFINRGFATASGRSHANFHYESELAEFADSRTSGLMRQFHSVFDFLAGQAIALVAFY